ncbi:hypothetical protein BZZ01_04525 [Nostocales cyanobacterium HT-58-2]|nr:hypothetical protein BZZ01_04525 [Nostocales cyanobacterium HT-58-2]
MPKTAKSIDTYRKTFQSFYGKPVTLLQWTRYSREMLESGLPLNTKGLELFAKFKQRCPRAVLSKAVLESLKDFQIKHRNKTEWYGAEVEAAIRKLLPAIAEIQIYRAFYRAGLSFRAKRIYEQKQVYDVVFYALIYGGTDERTGSK